MNNNIVPDPDAIRYAENQGIVFSEDKKTLLKCTNHEITEVVVPDSVTEIASDAFKGAACEEQVKRDYPHLFDLGNDCENLNDDAFCIEYGIELKDEDISDLYTPWGWSHFLSENPEWADKSNKWDKFDGNCWSNLLPKQPQFADKCDKWGEFDGEDWSKLLREQPQFADKCDWCKLSDENWEYLLEEQPQFAEKRK